MKSTFILPLWLVLVFMASCSSTKSTTESIREITRKVESKDFTVDVNYANPMSGQQIFLTNGYNLRIKNDSAFAYLPYYGVAYSAPYGGEGGIKFAEPMSNYSCLKTKKSDGWDIRFKVKAKENGYDITVNIFINGNSTISVNSFNRQSITFYGELKK